MLFSQPEIVDLLNSRFECAWQEVRPVPKVEIDFGNGHRLERTLNGNIATWYLTPEGQAFDLLPGLVGPSEFLDRTQTALRIRRPRHGKDLAEHLRVWHTTLSLRKPVPYEAEPKVFLSKAMVERPIKEAVRPGDRDLADDTNYNRLHRYAPAHALLAEHVLADPADLTNRVYRDILGVDLEDPYLGLAPYVLGGEAGRH